MHLQSTSVITDVTYSYKKISDFSKLEPKPELNLRLLTQSCDQFIRTRYSIIPNNRVPKVRSRLVESKSFDLFMGLGVQIQCLYRMSK